MTINIVLLVGLLAAAGWYGLSLMEPSEPEGNDWGDGRDLRTPVGRLIGQWRFISEAAADRPDLYFGEPDRTTGRGETYLVQTDGVTVRWQYVITREARNGMLLDIDCYRGEKKIRSVKMSLAGNGTRARYVYSHFGKEITREMEYISTQTLPPALRESQ